jgi:hypothetical protein
MVAVMFKSANHINSRQIQWNDGMNELALAGA